MARPEGRVGAAGAGHSPTMPRPGDVVAGKYAIVRVLGEGGMGIVYEATHQRLRQRVALKMLLPAMLEQEVIVSRFEREARAAAQLRGRHVARVSDVDVTSDGLPYMVMDFLEGKDLQVEIDGRGMLPVMEAVDYVLQACAAMLEAHQLGIVHRDLKPSNLFLEALPDAVGEARGCIVKVLDFGISKVQAEGDLKLTGADTVMGTALYMSPEQIRASSAAAARADIWALGVILYEALAGRVPWLGPPHQVAAAIVTSNAPDLRGFRPDVPPELAAIVHKTLQRDPNERFADVKQLAFALAPFAPVGSIGRSFADHFSITSQPRVSLTPSDSMQSLAPAAVESARTLIQARGVTESTPEQASNKRATAFVLVLVAFVLGVAAVATVVVLKRREVMRPEVVAVKTAAPPATLAPLPPVVSAEPAPSETAAPVADPAPPTSKAAIPSAKAPSARPVARPAAPSAAPENAARPPAAPPSSSSAVVGKPLFL